MSQFAAIKADFMGNNGSGSISIPALQVGDVIIFAKFGNSVAYFCENTVSIAGELQQLDPDDLSSTNCTIIAMRFA